MKTQKAPQKQETMYWLRYNFPNGMVKLHGDSLHYGKKLDYKSASNKNLMA